MQDEKYMSVPGRVLEKHNFYETSRQQREDDASRRMAELGHPLAADYRRFRAFYDALPYCSDANFRFYAFIDERNFVEFGAPVLRLGSRTPPSEAEIIAAAEGGWPDALVRDLGRFFFTVADTELKRALAQALGVATPKKAMVGGETFQSPERFGAIKAVVDRLFAGHLLAPAEWQRFDGFSQDPVPRRLQPLLERLATAKDAWL